MKTSTKTGILSEWLQEKMQNKEITNAELVQFIELAGSYLNLQTIPNYAKEHNLSYNGVKNNRNIVKVFGVRLVADNL